MSSHDPLCPFSDTFGAPCMYCALITRVRADQDNRECDHCTDLARLKIADLRAKVEALRSAPSSGPYAYGSGYRNACVDVLVLLDGDA